MNPPEMGDFVSAGDRHLSVAKMPVIAFSIWKENFQIFCPFKIYFLLNRCKDI